MTNYEQVEQEIAEYNQKMKSVRELRAQQDVIGQRRAPLHKASMKMFRACMAIPSDTVERVDEFLELHYASMVLNNASNALFTQKMDMSDKVLRILA